MRRLFHALLLTLLIAVPSTSQLPPVDRQPQDPAAVRLPNGKLQRDEILKADHQKNLEDLTEMMKLTEDLKIELEKGEGQVLSLSALKKVDQIEKLAKRVRGRLKR
jgi:hypothetical protein